MIIDCHSHIWPSPASLGSKYPFTCLGAPEALSAGLDDHLVSSEQAEVVFVLGYVSKFLKAEIPNSFISSYVAQHPGKMLAFAGVDPTDPGCIDDIYKLKNEQNFVGLVLSPACQNFHPCDTRAMAMYELAQELAMPIYFLNGESLPVPASLDFARPAALDEVACAFPELKMIISHFGIPWIDQTLALLAKHKNIFTDIAGIANKPWHAYRTLNLAYEFGIIEKVLFASDFPRHTVKSVAEAIYNLNKITLDSVLPTVPREHLRGIVERNSLELLGLDLNVNKPKPAVASAESDETSEETPEAISTEEKPAPETDDSTESTPQDDADLPTEEVAETEAETKTEK